MTSSTDSNPFLVRGITIPEGDIPTAEPEIAPIEDRIEREELAEPPIEVYESKTGRPYLVEVMDLASVYGRTGQEHQVDSINGYLIQQINELGLKSTKESYRAELSKLESQVGIDPNTDYPDRLDKLSVYVEMLQRRSALKKLREIYG